MKNIRYITLALATAIAAAGCGKEGPEVTDGTDAAITFGAVYTKALVESVTPMQNNGIAVFGFETDSRATTTAIFNNVPLAYADGTWSYTDADGSRYWTPGSTYRFIGLYPKSAAYTYTGTTVNLSHSTGTYVAGGQSDILAAGAYRLFDKSAANPYDKSAVALQMRHLLSAIVFKVRNASTEETLSITSATFTGIYTSGNCAIDVSADGGYTATWTTTGSVIPVTDVTTYVGDKAVNDITPGVREYDLYQEKLLVIPQLVSSDEITLNLSIQPATGAAYNKSLKLNAANSSSDMSAWQPGKKYTYIADITDKQITFKLSVNDWIEDEEIEL